MAGLTMALELARRDRPCIVVERTPRLEEVGAGLQLSPNALRVLARLGDLDDLKARGTVADVIYLGAVNHYLVALDAGPTLTVLRQNLHGSTDQALGRRGQQVSVGWADEHVIDLSDTSHLKETP